MFCFKKKKGGEALFYEDFLKTSRAVKLTIIYRKLYDWEWVGGERRKGKIS